MGRSKDWKPFTEARAFIRGLCLKNQKAWRLYCVGRIPGKGKRPQDIPSAPHYTYQRQGWSGYGDWLGTGNTPTFLRKYRPYERAREFAHQLHLRGKNEWKVYIHGTLTDRPTLPFDIPYAPDHVYKRQGTWKGWGDWVGTGEIATFRRIFRSFPAARNFARTLRLNSWQEWVRFIRGEIPGKTPPPPDIPHDPRRYYGKKIWRGWADWLGNEQARRYVSVRRHRRPGKRFFIIRRIS